MEKVCSTYINQILEYTDRETKNMKNGKTSERTRKVHNNVMIVWLCNDINAEVKWTRRRS